MPRVESRLLDWAFRCVAALVAATATASFAVAQTSQPARSTTAGVYTDEQASRGKDTYAMQCKSCHTPASHTGATFAQWWDKKPLSELFLFITTRMPKNEPGSLQPDEYADLVAYLLKMNEMPSGTDALPADSLALRKIRIETVRKDP